MEQQAAPDLSNVRPVTKQTFELDLTHLLDGSDESGGEDGAQDAHQQHVGREDIQGDDAFILKPVLSQGECERLVQETERLTYTFWNQANDTTTYRNADTVEVLDPKLAEAIWQRIKHLVLERITITRDQDRWEAGFEGTWKAVGVNEHLLFARYHEGGHFSPHTDGYTIVDFNKRSLFTLLLYLNDCEEGGSCGTQLFKKTDTREYVVDAAGRFRWEDAMKLGRAPPSMGTALAFYQDMPHEGEPVGKGSVKYIIRTDVMYAREDPICDEPKDREAYRLFREAEEVESSGDAMGALKLFQRAAKMSPALADVLGL
ncbi:hypothetical protein PTSG_00137 [Salpingoeca rosetta]|uniref:Fe2OG dioxygenase domain-containing protein n=1 Tax=Salpingoeca rosetta (strain ATCC 50818 / BSB-021) TaxID=946362 RepID=F2TVM3_SALR5|nr:uncharacterized protein PTSG_00137 [Salpingoeca rosetta]EGD72119.1 hypothetical protein PTSG_00137 [Salpingoeca rosetta]|eukprot:XP_004998691.1 hypothetical protein PTSG_00137 [Salpingoeca rosetta]